MNAFFTPEIIDAIAEAVVRKLDDRTENDVLSDEQVAEILGIRRENKRYLSSRLSWLCSPRNSDKPLVCFFVGRSRRFRRRDVMEFLGSRRRN